MNRPLHSVAIGQNDLSVGLEALPAWYRGASLAGMAIGAYHGYARNESVGWAIGWAFLGGLAPLIVVPVALAQGLGKKA